MNPPLTKKPPGSRPLTYHIRTLYNGGNVIDMRGSHSQFITTVADNLGAKASAVIMWTYCKPYQVIISYHDSVT